MTFGRPTMISRTTNVPVPSLIDDEYLSVEGTGKQPAHIPSRMGLFIFSCSLFEILDMVMSKFYTGSSDTKPASQIESENRMENMISDVMSIIRRLDDFQGTLPTYLQVTGTSQAPVPVINGYIQLQQQILYCRYCSLCLYVPCDMY